MLFCPMIKKHVSKIVQFNWKSMEKLVEFNYEQIQKFMKEQTHPFYWSPGSPSLDGCFNSLHLGASVYTAAVFPLWPGYIGLFGPFIWPNSSLDLGDFQELNDAPNC